MRESILWTALKFRAAYFLKPYAADEPMEDLLQEAYFGLWEAVQHYEMPVTAAAS